MTKRKTASVSAIIDRVNAMLSHDGVPQEEKRGACIVLESVLFDANVYAGFGYLPSAGLRNPGQPSVSVENEYDRKYHKHSCLG